MKTSLPSIPLSQTDTILNEFFVKDGGLTPPGAIRNSTLLACKRDFLFLRGSGIFPEEHKLSSEQQDILLGKMPVFAGILVYCSTVDLLARIMKRSVPKNMSKAYFLWSAKRWFNHSNTRASALWELRCGVSHQYKIEPGLRAVPAGFSGSMRYNRVLGKWEFNLNGMFGDIRRAISDSHRYLNSLTLPTRNKYARFIYEHGFFYTNS